MHTVRTTAPRKLSECEQELHEAAVRAVGFGDFGAPDYIEGLRALLCAFDVDLQLTDVGRQTVFGMVSAVLASRLYVEKGWAMNAGVLEEPIHRPIFVIGLPRSGTTAMHRLLAVDAQFQGLETWLLANPMPRPRRNTWEQYAEYRTCAARLERRSPELSKAHPMAVDELEECNQILIQNFCNCGWDMWVLLTYAAWRQSRGSTETYRRYADVLRLIGAHESQKRWLLKSPFHTFDIDALLSTFPDACVIHMHRDPLRTIPSLCSWHSMLMPHEATGFARPEQHGPWQCAFWREALDRAAAANKRSPSRFFHVDHQSFVADPLETVRSVYDFLGLTLLPEAERQLRAWVALTPTRRHGAHLYQADGWGVTPEQIREAFACYRAERQFDNQVLA